MSIGVTKAQLSDRTIVPSVGGLTIPNLFCAPSNAGANVGFTPIANQTNVWMFELGFSISLSKVSFIVNTNSGSPKAAISIYNQLGSKIADTGAFTVGSSSTIQTVSLLSPVTLPPGVYFVAWTSDSLAAVWTTNAQAGYSANILDSLYNKNQARLGAAANSAVASVLPATLGTITPFTGSNASSKIPFMFFE